MMSERDPRYDPRTLLASASESDADTESQRLAIKTFHSLSSKIEENKTSIVLFSSVVETMEGSSQDDPVLLHAKSKIRFSENTISSLNKKIEELLDSDDIQPLIQKLMDKTIDANHAEFKRKQKEAYQHKAEEERKDDYDEKLEYILKRLENNHTVPIKTDIEKKENAIKEAAAGSEAAHMKDSETKKRKDKLSDKISVIFWIVLIAVPPVLGICFQLQLQSPAIEKIGNGSFLWGLIVSAGAILGSIRVARGLFALVEQEEKEGKASYVMLFIHIFSYICMALFLHRI